MNITRILRDVAERQKADGQVNEVIYTWTADANVKVGTSAIPLIFIELPTSIELSIERSAALELARVDVWFLTNQPRLQFDATANENLIDAMLSIAIDYIARLKAETDVKVVAATLDTGLVYDAGDRNLTGVRLRIDIQDLKGHCFPTYKYNCL